MSKKRTLADLMDNDFFIDFEDTKVKTERKSLNESLKESRLKEGFYDYDYDLSEDKISEKDLYKALVTDGELISLNAGDQGKQVSFKDKGRYSDTTYEITEYDGKFSIAEFHNSDDGDWSEGDYYFETDSFESLCAELEKLFPGALVECKIKEEIEEPDNAVVDCKVNKVIAHCEDEKPVDCLGEKKPLEKPLTEGTRSIEEIKAEIEKLQQELADAEAKEKRADYGRNLPTEVWIYDMYIDPANKGTWTSAELYNGKYDGYVYETADKAIRGGLAHLNELADEGELEGDPIDYTVEAINIPISEVDEDTLADSGLDYLIESLKESLSDVDSVRVMAWCTHHCVDFFKAVADNAPKAEQRKLNKEAYKAMKEKFGLAGQEANTVMRKAYSLWKSLYSKKLTEATGDNSYTAMMKVQEYIENTLGWDIIDCQQDDEDSMMLYCDGAWDDDAIKDLENFASDNGVDISVVDSGKSSYDYRVYLSC